MRVLSLLRRLIKNYGKISKSRLTIVAFFSRMDTSSYKAWLGKGTHIYASAKNFAGCLNVGLFCAFA